MGEDKVHFDGNEVSLASLTRREPFWSKEDAGAFRSHMVAAGLDIYKAQAPSYEQDIASLCLVANIMYIRAHLLH